MAFRVGKVAYQVEYPVEATLFAKIIQHVDHKDEAIELLGVLGHHARILHVSLREAVSHLAVVDLALGTIRRILYGFFRGRSREYLFFVVFEFFIVGVSSLHLLQHAEVRFMHRAV